MFIIFPPVRPLKHLEYTTFETKNVPYKSISITVLNALGVSLSKGTRKLPAAPFTKISIFPTTYIK